MRFAGLRIVESLAVLATVMALPACDRGADEGSAASARERVEPAVHKPHYAFAAGLEEAYPDVCVFLRQFMETALAGDYTGYRRLVSRVADPESKTRFEKILNALQSLTIESIETVDLARYGVGTGYLVTSRVVFVPNPKVALRRPDRNGIAILVFEEEGELRMMPAPAELQPRGEGPTSAESPTTTSAPSYPWDEDGDY
ncbi:MAG: hypothetical protein AB1601_06475 [Planctomycetota bacterium]